MKEMRWLSDPLTFAKSRKARLKSDVSNRRKKTPANKRKTFVFNAGEKTKRCSRMFEAVDRIRMEIKQRFNGTSLVSEAFGFLKPHALLRRGGIDTDMNKFKKTSADGIDDFQLTVETALCNRPSTKQRHHTPERCCRAK